MFFVDVDFIEQEIRRFEPVQHVCVNAPQNSIVVVEGCDHQIGRFAQQHRGAFDGDVHRIEDGFGAPQQFLVARLEQNDLHGSRTVATAWAARPSCRPVNPSPSVVVALTLTRAMSRASISATRARMASRCGPIFGRSQMIVTSQWTIAPPLLRTRLAAWSRNFHDGASRQRSSLGGKCTPISPAPIAPRIASVSACKPASASEWPSNAWSCAIFIPQSQTWSPAMNL